MTLTGWVAVREPRGRLERLSQKTLQSVPPWRAPHLPSAARARPAHGPDEPCVGVATKSWSMTSSCSCLRSARINRPRAVERRRLRNVLTSKNQKHRYDLPLRNHLGLHPAGLHRRLAGHLEAMVNAKLQPQSHSSCLKARQQDGVPVQRHCWPSPCSRQLLTSGMCTRMPQQLPQQSLARRRRPRK